ALDLELLVGVALLAEGPDDLGRGRGILVRPSDTGHALEVGVERGRLGERMTLEGLTHDVVLDDLVLDACLAEAIAEVGDELDGDPTKVDEDHGGGTVDALPNFGRLRDLLFTRHHHVTPPTGWIEDRRG